LVGANNSGKTTVTESLSVLLGRERLVRNFTEHDFFGSTPEAGHEIRIVGTITDFRHNDPARHQQWFRQGRAVEKWRDSETGKLQPTKRAESDTLACQIAFAARFDQEALEVETFRYFYDDERDDDPFLEDSGLIPFPTSLIKEFGFFLVPANRTWERAISFSSELFRRVVTQVGGKPAEAVLSERGRLRDPESALERDDKIAELIAKVDADILDIFGRPSELKLRITSTDSAGVLEAVVPHFKEGAGVAVPSRRQGSGLLSLQTLILLLRFGHLRVQKGDNFVLAIEEPELHVPPSLQRRVLRLTQSVATQTIITSHSPTVAAVPSPHEVLLLLNDGGVLRGKSLLDGPLTRDANSVERALFLSDRDATVSALMHPHVLIPEGKTDASWLQLLSRIVELFPSSSGANTPAFSHEVGVIPTRRVERMPEIFAYLSRVHPAVSCLVDGDRDGSNYVNRLTALEEPPKVIIQWPKGWAIEHVVAWLLAADPDVLSDPEIEAIGISKRYDELIGLLITLKADEVVHSILADAIARNVKCSARTSHLLNVLGDVLHGRQPVRGANAIVSSNGVSTIWTFESDVSGI
jgi:hypothetical protein